MWSYGATFFTVGAGVILLPFILSKMSAETVGIWSIFQTITTLITLLDFGFRPSFARNVSYIFSGIKNLKVNGVEQIEDNEVDYALLRGTLEAMQRFYRWIAISIFLLLAVFGSIYFRYILSKYDGNQTDAIVAWGLLIVLNSYNLYTMYYDSLLTGKGYIKRCQQISILGQVVYLSVAIGLIYAGLGLSAIVGAQSLSIFIKRVMTYKVFYTPEMTEKINQAEAADSHTILRTIMPNAIKVGITQLGGFLVNKSSVLLGSAFLSLEQLACYGITMQVMEILARCGSVFYQSYTPKLAQCQAEGDYQNLRKYYKMSIASLVSIYIVGGGAWVCLGDYALTLIHSTTTFVAVNMLSAIWLFNLLEHNHSIAAGFIMAGNKIPFFIPSILSGAATVILLYLFLGPMHMGVWGMILAPGIAQLCYQNWKWPSMVIKELFIDNK